MHKFYKYLSAREKLMKVVFLLSSIFSIVALAFIILFLLITSIPPIANIGLFKFIFGTNWQPESGHFGIMPMIFGTIYLTCLAMVMGAVFGLLAAVFLYKFCPKRFVEPARQVVNILAGIPSVVYGLFAMLIIVPFVQVNLSPNYSGTGLLSASLILAIMIMPTVISISLDAMLSVPKSYFEGALALGATKEQAVFKVMMPAAKSGIFASIVLATARAMGETMAVVMVIGNIPNMSWSVFESSATLTSNIAMSVKELSGDAQAALIASGLVLLILSLMLNVGFSLIKNKKPKKKDKQSFIKRLCIKRCENEAK